MRSCSSFAALLLSLLAIGSLAGCGRDRAAEGKGEVRVAAAADLKFAFDELLGEFREEHPDVEVSVSYGASGAFFAQLSNKAPFDVFLSADVTYPRQLIEKGLARKEDEFVYAVGHLVVWVPKDSPVDLERQGARALLDERIRKVAIANPRHAPYGRAAEKALQNLKVYDEVKGKLVLGENVTQAAQFVESGAADAGVFALSLALSPAMRDKGRYWEAPQDAFPRLEQGGVILSWARDREAAEKLRDFLASDRGKAVLKRYGFALPGE
jgi:molybdate transport system substrate-binding protein